MARGSVPLWQPLALSGILGFVLASTFLCLTRRIRSIAQPWVTSRVKSETKLVLQIQRWHNRHLDNFFSVLSFIVSVPFYTGFLPLLDWSGHCKLSRQMTLLMAFCNYLGNSIKDAVSASRPSSPPVKRITATEDEKEYAMEYGFPSTHALNTVCLLGYLLNYVTTNAHDVNHFTVLIGFFSCFFFLFPWLDWIYIGTF
ncbi:hypothetical protein HPP92_020366 [Vanilla planifolia]|uniref:Phosphatidic acid phosphatase type 2/haloperoxidase domain-containing protein n=1 Tax=Vanilla planifolia TaxID=51239 RepID=A0A835Q7L6_VANPL|nr:hypothetical protein HPP92_020366 [Vanilla planifolia]